jgi:hypothetical protein
MCGGGAQVIKVWETATATSACYGLGVICVCIGKRVEKFHSNGNIHAQGHCCREKSVDAL